MLSFSDIFREFALHSSRRVIRRANHSEAFSANGASRITGSPDVSFANELSGYVVAIRMATGIETTMAMLEESNSRIFLPSPSGPMENQPTDQASEATPRPDCFLYASFRKHLYQGIPLAYLSPPWPVRRARPSMRIRFLTAPRFFCFFSDSKRTGHFGESGGKIPAPKRKSPRFFLNNSLIDTTLSEKTKC